MIITRSSTLSKIDPLVGLAETAAVLAQKKFENIFRAIIGSRPMTGNKQEISVILRDWSDGNRASAERFADDRVRRASQDRRSIPEQGTIGAQRCNRRRLSMRRI
jgi:hypothetical protein